MNQDILDFLVYTHELHKEVRKLFTMISCHDLDGLKKAFLDGEKYETNQMAYFEKDLEETKVDPLTCTITTILA